MIVAGTVLYRHADDHDLIPVDRDRVTVTRQIKVGLHGTFVVIAADVDEAGCDSLSLTLNHILRTAG